MASTNFITALRKLFPDSQWSWVLPALTLDPTVWNCVENILPQAILKRSSSRPEDYTPYALALLIPSAENSDCKTNLDAQASLAAGGMVNRLEHSIYAKPLLDACQAGAQLHQQYQQHGAWNAVQGLTSASQTALACLFNLTAEKHELIHAFLLDQRSSFGDQSVQLEKLVRAVLSNPYPPEEHITYLHRIYASIDNYQATWMMNLFMGLRPDLGAKLSSQLLDEPLKEAKGMPDKAGITRTLDKIFTLQERASMQNHAGQAELAIQKWQNSYNELQQLSAHVASQQARAAQKDGNLATALIFWGKASTLSGNKPEYIAAYALALIKMGRGADAQARLDNPEIQSNPWILHAQARLAQSRGQVELACQSALQAWAQYQSDQKPADPTFDHLQDLLELSILLLELGKPSEASAAAEEVLKHAPGSPEAHAVAAQAYHTANQVDQALASAHKAAAMQPDRIEHKVVLANCLGKGGDWSAAYQERRNLTAMAGSQGYQENYTLAACALMAGEYGDAVEIAQPIVDADPSNGLAWAVLGEACARSGDSQTALSHLTKALELSPQHPAPWISLAKFYQAADSGQKWLETLQSATLAAPEYPEVQLALGEAYLSRGLLTQALAALRQASRLVESGDIPAEQIPWYRGSMLPPTLTAGTAVQEQRERRQMADQINFGLGQTLFRLGHIEEANKVLAAAYEHAPHDAEIAWQYAQALLALNDRSAALRPLRTVIDSGVEDTTPYLNYARLILDGKGLSGTSTQATPVIPYMRTVLSISPDHPEATAYLAEALAAEQDWESARQSYLKVMESTLADDPKWKSRLAYGLGVVSHQLGQNETAIAVLREASHSDPHDARIQQALSEAYLSAGLANEAHHCACLAQESMPDDPDNLIWVAGMFLDLDKAPVTPAIDFRKAALDTLQRATQINPERYDVWRHLGQAYLYSGNLGSAQQSFRVLAEKISSSEPGTELSVDDLFTTAQGLMETGDPMNASVCLENALKAKGNDPKSPSHLDMLTLLTRAYFQAGHADKALEILEQTILIDASEAKHHVEKAYLLARLDHNSGEIEKAIQSAKELYPENSEVYLDFAQIFRLLGDLPRALDHANQFIQTSTDGSEINLIARAFAADMALGMLQPDIAEQYLEHPVKARLGYLPSQSTKSGEYKPGAYFGLELDFQPVDFFCSRAENQIAQGNYSQAINELIPVIEHTPTNPRLSALQARLVCRRNDLNNSQSLLESAVDGMRNLTSAPLPGLVTMANAAVEIQKWDIAQECWEEIVRRCPREPRSHLEMARLLTKQAEYQRLCDALEIISHAPGTQTIEESNYRLFDQSIAQTSQLVEALHWNQDQDESRAGPWTELTQPAIQWIESNIERWERRGQAAFYPSQENAQKLGSLPHNPEDTAARIACLRQVNDAYAAGLAAREYPRDPNVLIQLTLALINDRPRQALAAAQVAKDTLESITGDIYTDPESNQALTAPLIQALTARMLYQNGNTLEDRQAALEAVRTALAYWPNEPRWHMLAADIHLAISSGTQSEDLQSALIHLEQAVEIEPGNAEAYIKIGQLYFKSGLHHQAIQPFEKAAQLSPEDASPRMWLANTYRKSGSLAQAADQADLALQLIPDQPEPTLLRGEIALDARQPLIAETCAQTVLQNTPDHPQALTLLARAMDAMNKPDEALVIIEKGLQQVQDSLPLQLVRVGLLQRTRGASAALQAAERLVEAHPDDAKSVSVLAEVQESAGRTQDALTTAQRALRVMGSAPGYPKDEQARIHHLLGRLLRGSGQLDQAVFHLNHAAQLSPETVEVYLDLGLTYQERREFSQALSVFRKALSTIPNDPRPYVMIGQALKDSKDYIGAETMLRRASELAPADLSIHRQLAAVVALNLVHNRRGSAVHTPMGR